MWLIICKEYCSSTCFTVVMAQLVECLIHPRSFAEIPWLYEKKKHCANDIRCMSVTYKSNLDNVFMYNNHIFLSVSSIFLGCYRLPKYQEVDICPLYTYLDLIYIKTDSCDILMKLSLS